MGENGAAMQLRIVLLEENRVDAELIGVTLSMGGLDCGILRADSEAGFLDVLKQGSPDAILSDYSISGFIGIKALETARKLCPDVPFIFVSGALGEELAIETLKQGALDFVLKHRLQRLVPSLRRALREAAERAERKKAEKQIVELNEQLRQRYAESEQISKMKDEFLAVLSHELRTPLTAIFGWTRLVQTGKLSAEDTLRAIDVIEKNTRIQMQLVNDLLDLSRISSGRFELEQRTVELAPMIQAAINVVMPFAEAKKVEIHAVLQRPPFYVTGDRERLQQVMWNLLSNAVKFSAPKTGRVEVRLERVDGQAQIHVMDNGRGISPEFMPRLFTRFSQADTSSTRPHGGLGLGLAIARHMAELHGGSIKAESAGAGHGATFTVNLPLVFHSADVELPRPPEQPISLRLDGLRVMVVEDDADTREMLGRVLKDNGASVMLMESAKQAMDCIMQSNPDVIVSDIGMPDEDGYSFARRLGQLEKSLGRSFPTIALTAHARSGDRARALAAGYKLHVPKPVEPAHLVSVVANLARSKA